MRTFIIIVALLNFLCLKTNGSISSANTYKIFKDVKINESEWQNSLFKAYRALSKLKCISDCPLKTNKLITFNKINNICKYYTNCLTNQTKLIESRGDFVYNYQQKIVNNNQAAFLNLSQTKNITTDCTITRLITLPDSKFASGCSNTGKIQIWSSINWTLVLSFSHGIGINSFAVLPNKYLLSGSDGNSNGYRIKMWNYETGLLIKQISVHSFGVNAMKVLNNGNIASASTNGVLIWNSTDETQNVSSLGNIGEIFDLVQLNNGKLVTVGSSCEIKLWNALTFDLIKSINTSPDQMYSVVQLNNEDLFVGSQFYLKIYDSNSLDLKYTLPGNNLANWKIIQLQNGNLASAIASFKIKIWDLNTLTLKQELIGHANGIYGLIELPNGYLVSAEEGLKIIVWQ